MAFKMKGHSLPGPNQKKSRKHRAYEMSKEHAGKPGFQEHMDKVFGGPTTVRGSVTHTKIDSPAKAYGHKSPAKKELIGDQKNLPEELKAKIEAAPGKMYGKKSPAKQKKTYPKSYTKKDIAFLKKQKEDVVRREDLDEKGKKIYDANQAKLKAKKKTSNKKKTEIKKRKGNWEPAFPGADHSKEELKKMTKKQKEDYYN